ncbi:MAG: YraN family protein [Chloroflexi bacterium]|nr:YraN family protein [Chloroflexota bacterium]
MSRHNQIIGRWGEMTAAEYLSKRGYSLVARNVRTPYGEIDLVVRRDGMTIFVEVKTRSSARFGYPEDSINARKQEHMLAAAEHYAQENALEHWQIDAIAVEGKPGREPKITHFENVI